MASVHMVPVGDDGVMDIATSDFYTRQLWCAYYSDYSGIALFADELEALRHAVGTSMQCKQVRLGGDLLEQLR